MNKKIATIFLLFFTVACSALPFGSEISGPTVEPPVPASGTVLYQDDFANSASGWDHVNDPSGAMDYDGGVYHILVKNPNLNYFATPGKNFRDTRVEVDAVKIGGPDNNRAGIICRMSTTNNVTQFYFFVISNDGYFAVGRTSGNQSYLLGQTAIAQSSAIKTGLAINHLRADCSGNTLSFYVNGFLVSQVIDNALSEGEVGVLAGSFAEPNVDMVFDSFIVLQP